jgi:hypothetical protein
VHCTKQVVIGQQMIEAERLRRPTDAPHRLGVTAQLDLRLHHTDLRRYVGAGSNSWFAGYSITAPGTSQSASDDSRRYDRPAAR